ncbi:MAG: hypothetical protein SF028_12875 [Candidatus Sumerlaeia bacterium]|nr:hypothetical protein [Candidatus Sumerlaeia bacterium]
MRNTTLLAALLAATIAAQAQRVIDGDPSDWVGTPSSTIHATVVDSAEWIYTGEAGDQRTFGANAWANFDITEVRLAATHQNLYVLVRLADITATNEPSLALGFDSDRTVLDSNGLGFLGDASGITYPDASFNPEYQVQIHNAQNGITWAEYFHDAGSGFWYSNPGDADTFISAANNVVEARLSLASLELTPTSVVGFHMASFDNGTTGNPGGQAFNNDDDTTVDYPDADALDGIGGFPGVSGNAWVRVFGANGQYTPTGLAPVDLSVLAGPAAVRGWMLYE